ncbi:hypothetical protein PENTCL1PPCAC_21064 [Pristionchus entomophagus]|uniref:Uncharacterized protein n=1 Tax=Pristionchus entomophagus TaxID=358040 RepID=A0AAV5TY36_9BILA|nr:hypothetical protein PENTCL1PPCAC_21064 [Pristionchus entomophagus]
MSSFLSLSIVLAVFAIGEARVTFPYSEVIQRGDLQHYRVGDDEVYKAPFNCSAGCKVFSDQTIDDNMSIVQNGENIANFTEIAGGYELDAGDNYEIAAQTRADFVFYVASIKAPNNDTPVLVLLDGEEALVDDQSRYSTVISSLNALHFYEFRGQFPTGYPKIYTTGFDAMSYLYGISSCSPVFTARSQSNAEQSEPLIFAPIVTIDFGFVGVHSVSVNTTDGTSFPKSAASSTIYMSPGHVGCPFEVDQMYSSNKNSISDKYTLIANSLDISTAFYKVQSSEMVELRVNQDILDFYNNTFSVSTTAHYDEGAFAVFVSWTRRTSAASWSIQLDFGADPLAPTSAPQITTTSSAGGLSLLLSVVVMTAFV